MLLQMAGFHLFLSLNDIPLCIYMYAYIHPFSHRRTHRLFLYLHILTTKNNARMKTGDEYIFSN